eukprot:CAMPEP_0174823992 /NCGR_PEP_ID=MMETSP1107-20130205/29524_1 /TAXON_ID=36770 /ORGANISM="Paraphysomonas vestita, Strain GFlagA" /LENGTH=269 /DNA_ID=CAMNT_0016048949 /DNA_START=150 /DNA_END=956 /DNA_ORIENTATION=+
MKYYYNKITRETTWTQPKCLQPRKSNNNFLEATRNPTGKPFGGLKRQPSTVQDSDDEPEVETKSVSRSPSPKPMAVALPGLDGTNHARSLSPIPKQSPKNEQEKAHNEPTWARSTSPVRERAASPPPGIMKKKIVESVSTSSPIPSPIVPTPSKVKTNAFAALRVLEQEKDLTVDTDDISVGYDDGKIIRNSDIGPPSNNSRNTNDPFPTKPLAPIPTLYDGLSLANITTEELLAKATFPLETYAESRYKFERKGIFNLRTSLDKLLSW